jgi:hypothetical protein
MAIDDLHSGSAHHHYDLHDKIVVTEGGKIAIAVIALVTFLFAGLAVSQLMKEERALHNSWRNPLPHSSESRKDQ